MFKNLMPPACKSSTMVVQLYLLLLFLSSSPLSGGAFSEYSCNDIVGNYTANNAFQANLQRLSTTLPTNAASSPSLFASGAIGATADTVFGLALCRGDITDTKACSACLSEAFRRLQTLCSANRDATFYQDLCLLLYSGDDFLARPGDNSPVINAMDVNGSTYPEWDGRNATIRSFVLSLGDTLFRALATYGAYNSTARRFASAVMYFNPKLPMVYGLAQCTPDLQPSQCWSCFQGLQAQIRDCYDGRVGGRILGVRCNFRYEGYQFYGGTPDVTIGVEGGALAPGASPSGSEGSNHKRTLITVLASSITVFCFMLVGCLLLIRQLRKGSSKMMENSRNNYKTKEALKLWKIEESSSSDFTLYDFSELAAATENFSEENKLGADGFGPVYKGQLPDGAEIAVKRLATHSRQGLKEFKNEIQLIAKLQHTNLVRLLGCCVQEEENILVYEYMPNRSLDFFIFDQQRRLLIDWNKRLHIIEGIAHGLLYLHKHSRVRIIHRDLKASNILLDKNLNPKISDFGMTKIFGLNMTETNTNRVVGTYGYMAPEYASEGIFSMKSDVFSYGVLLLEVISGKRSTGLNQYGDFVNLLGYAWQLCREGRGFELIDPSLGDCADVTAVMRCIKVALLCVQENAMHRPTMSDVISVLGNDVLVLPDPRRPPHFDLRITSDGSEVRTRSENCSGLCSTNDVTITIEEGR